MVLNIVIILGLCVLIGSLFISKGARRLNLSAKVMAIAFALTAASWLGFLITAIGLTIKTLISTSV